mgnify:CR=1 FL=1
MHASRRSLFALALFVVAAPAARAEEVEPFASRAATGIEDLIWRHVFSDEAPTFEGEGDAVAQTEAAAPTAVAPGRVVTIVLTGDTGFSRNQSPVNAKGVQKDGRLQPFAEATSGIAELIDGDLNFTNIETVVTDRNDLGRASKGESTSFFFRSHPNGIRHLVRLGFNVAGLANNHAMDFGEAGLRETLTHVAKLKADGLLASSGLGLDSEEATRPQALLGSGRGFGMGTCGSDPVVGVVTGAGSGSGCGVPYGGVISGTYFFFREVRGAGTLPPARRAWDSPIAMACFRLVTFLPEPPLRSVPRFRSCMAFSTFSAALSPYFRAPEDFRVVLRAAMGPPLPDNSDKGHANRRPARG